MKKKNPIAKAVTRIRPQTKPDQRRKKMAHAEIQDAALEKLKYYISEDPLTSAVYKRLRDR